MVTMTSLEGFEPVTIRGEQCLTMAESARYLGVSPATLRNILKQRSEEGRGIEQRKLEGRGRNAFLPIGALDAIKKGEEVPEKFLMK